MSKFKNSKKTLSNPVEELKKKFFNYFEDYKKNKEKQKAKYEREIKKGTKKSKYLMNLFSL